MAVLACKLRQYFGYPLSPLRACAMDRLLSALKRLLNSAMLIVAALASLLVAIALYSYAHEYYTETVPARQVKVAKFFVKENACDDPAYPLVVVFENKSSRTVLSIDFVFEAYYPGRSTNLAQYETYTDDYIRKPGDPGRGTCWRRPQLNSTDIKHSDVEYKVRITSVRFED
jgi:hypothetical protein